MSTNGWSGRFDFGELLGLRCRGYIRESTREQDEKSGPVVQQEQEIAFARQCSLIGPDLFYKDLISGTSIVRRSDFQRMVRDGERGEFDVLLVYDTSRFARNEADAFAYERRLHDAGVMIVYVMERLVSRDDDTSAIKGIHHVMNAEYSRKLRRKVTDGWRKKFERGEMAHPPLGYKGDGSIDSESATLVRLIFSLYTKGNYSYRGLAAHLNSLPSEQRLGRSFTKSSVEEVLGNPAYLGLVTYRRHKGGPDVREGKHTPIITQELWDKVQQLRGRRYRFERPSRKWRNYVFSGLGVCDVCGSKYVGEPHNGRRYLAHSREVRCGTAPRTAQEDTIVAQFGRWLGCFHLPVDWKHRVMRVLGSEDDGHNSETRRAEIERRLTRLRELYKWDDSYSKEEYSADKRGLEAELMRERRSVSSVNYDEAAKYLENVASLWAAVGPEEQKAFLQASLDEVRIRGWPDYRRKAKRRVFASVRLRV